jgi:hypothetical protein
MLRYLRIVAVGAVALVAAGLLTACEAINTVLRPAQPVVLTGTDLPDLVGTTPARIVAFQFSNVEGTPAWTQVPVQVDERKVVGFGNYPSSNSTAGVNGTVYGSSSTGVTALQYADPSTFIGADTNPNFDADDELVFMAFDMGGKRPASNATTPDGVVAGSGVEVEVEDPNAGVDARERGWVYLFESTGALHPSAGKDYVDYDFVLTSGNYKSTYKRASGPNPETSRVVTPTYEAEFTDRWKETSWKVRSAGASGVDLLDGHKNQFAVNSCGRSNETFSTGEGAFVANIDGPVRAIRSYVGANSGPLTQRTHLMYRDMEDIVTDLRVHAIPAIMDFVDLSPGAIGSTYRSSTVPAGVSIDGVNESVPSGVPTWESVNGSGGHVLTRSTFSSDISSLDVIAFYRDQTNPPEAQCWGDGSFLGAAGTHVVSAIPNTDPAAPPFNDIQARRVVQFGAPVSDPSLIPAIGAAWSADMDAELAVTASPLP